MLNWLVVLSCECRSKLVLCIERNWIVELVDISSRIPRWLQSSHIEIGIGLHTLCLESDLGKLRIAALTRSILSLWSEDTALANIIGTVNVNFLVDTKERIPLMAGHVIGTRDRRTANCRSPATLVSLVGPPALKWGMVERLEGSRIAHATIKELAIGNRIEKVDCLIADVGAHFAWR
jgi:hypothetical protein